MKKFKEINDKNDPKMPLSLKNYILLLAGLIEAVPELMTIAEAGKIAIILGSMIAGGIIISGLFTFAALNKFINMKSNKIYLY